MRDFARAPSRIERIIAIVLASVLIGVFGSLLFLSFYLQSWLSTAIFAAAFLVTSFLFHRAIFTARRALGSTETRILAWCFLVFGAIATLFVLLADGSITSRLMALGPALVFMAAGSSGIRK